MGGAETPAKALPLPTPPGLLGAIWVPLQDPGERSSRRNSGNCLSTSEDCRRGISSPPHTGGDRQNSLVGKDAEGLAQAGGGGGTPQPHLASGISRKKMGITQTTSFNPFTNPVWGLLSQFYR